MIDFEQAYRIVEASCTKLGAEKKNISDALGFVLAENIRAKESIPLFDSSAVDGFAVRWEDVQRVPCELRVIGTMQAGDRKKLSLRKGCAIKILTGAAVPPSATAIVMKEQVDNLGETIIVHRVAKQGEHIRRRGEEFSNGDMALKKGTHINPPVVGLLATLGYPNVSVYRKPKVSLILTGNELRSPSAKLRPGQIRDSNSYALCAALAALGIQPQFVSNVRDDQALITDAIRDALQASDIVITVGGVSVGDYDFVKEAFERLRVQTKFWRIAIKPGKPVYFGVKGKKLVFGLPGNPVAALLSFHLLVRMAIGKQMGRPAQDDFVIEATLGKEMKKKAGRMEFVRATLTKRANGNFTAIPTTGQESHMMGGFASAQGLIRFPKESVLMKKGTVVHVEMINWSHV